VAKFQFVLLVHAHQPAGNFDDVIERAYAQSYLPFLQTLSHHPSIRIGLHYTGSLLEWIEKAHPEYFDDLRVLVNRGQVELVGGGFYEPILVAIPPRDRHEQITRLSEYIEAHFGVRPRGAWLAERVWEPQLPSSLAPSGVDYTLVDDNHFLGAGFELNQLCGYYLAEDQGVKVKVLPGLKTLRYLIPFRDPEECIQFLRSCAKEHPGGFAAMGDDLEKFGVWPGTFELCYRNGWLERFFSALERNQEWLESSTPQDAASSHAPLGRADLPAASYTEMMEWALPTRARNRLHALLAEFASRPDVLPFMCGGIWRNFFSKYCESNLLHKKMLHVSRKVKALDCISRNDASFLNAYDRAKTLVLRGQCNDAYWHGVFGGLYSPHLRTALWQSLVEAETIADNLSHDLPRYEDSATIDFDADGHDEIYFTSDRYTVLLSAADGATISAIDCRVSQSPLVNSLTRRCEAYHAGIKNTSARQSQSVQSIHEQARAKEEGLDRWLHYDRWPRNCFRLLLFRPEKQYQDCTSVQLEENAALAGGNYRIVNRSATRATLVSDADPNWRAEKTFSLARTASAFEIACDVCVSLMTAGPASANLGIECVLNFLAPDAADRYFESDGQRHPLRWSSSTAGPELRVVDAWKGIAVTLSAPSVRNFWIVPIETVSESEDGFERIYQGSQIIAIWPLELSSGAEWRGQLKFEVAKLESH
jgi:4-alpha-glucanotransferase